MKDRIVVADASTLIGLSRINQLKLLRELFDCVLVPEHAYHEVVEEDKPGSERLLKKKPSIRDMPLTTGLKRILALGSDSLRWLASQSVI